MLITRDYLSGFFDGEGYIGLIRHKDKRVKRGYTLHPFVRITNTNKLILDEINKIVKGKIKSKPKQLGCKQCYMIELQNADSIFEFLCYIHPHLIIKEKQSELMIEFCRGRVKDNKNKEYTSEELSLYFSFKQLNKRGEELGILPTTL